MTKSKERNLPRALAAECIGTFILIFTGTGAVVANSLSDGSIGSIGISLVFGLVVMVLIYTFGRISGAHFYPAVSLGFALTRYLPIKRLLPYCIVQILGAILASIAVKYLIGSAADLGATHFTLPMMSAFVLEVILTYLLSLVIMAVATDTRAVGQAAAIAIGGTIAVEALFAGSLTGASMNPARSLGPALVSGNLNDIWLYILAPLVGGALGSLTYKWIGRQD